MNEWYIGGIASDFPYLRFDRVRDPLFRRDKGNDFLAPVQPQLRHPSRDLEGNVCQLSASHSFPSYTIAHCFPGTHFFTDPSCHIETDSPCSINHLIAFSYHHFVFLLPFSSHCILLDCKTIKIKKIKKTLLGTGALDIVLQLVRTTWKFFG